MRKVVRSFSSNEALIKEKRNHIVKQSAELFVKKGYDAVRVRDLLKACGMTQGGLYHYISSKEDILYLIVERVLSDSENVLKQLFDLYESLDTKDAVRECIKTYIEFGENNRNLLVVILRQMATINPSDRRRILKITESAISLFEGLLKKGVENGVFDINDCKLEAMKIVGLQRNWILEEGYLKKYYNVGQYIGGIVDSLFVQILNHKT